VCGGVYEESGVSPVRKLDDIFGFSDENNHNKERKRKEIVVEHKSESVKSGFFFGFFDGQEIPGREETIDEDQNVTK
jgi:hypothetical protein